MVRVTGSLWRNRFGTGKVPFNTPTDIRFSDSSAATGGGAQRLDDTFTGTEYQDDSLINATVYIVTVDGPGYAKVDDIDDLDPSRKQFYFDSATGTLTFSIDQLEPVDIIVFYSSLGTSALPAVEPVTLAEFKLYAKIDTGTIDDDLIEELITTAREQCEDYSGISIVNRTVTAVLNNSCGGIYLPYGPVISITSVTDQDDDDVLDTNDYTLSGLDFPQLIDPVSDKITSIYTAGYGIPPKRIKSAILQQTFYLYENRGEVDVDLTMSPQAKSTLKRIRRVG